MQKRFVSLLIYALQHLKTQQLSMNKKQLLDSLTPDQRQQLIVSYIKGDSIGGYKLQNSNQQRQDQNLKQYNSACRSNNQGSKNPESQNKLSNIDNEKNAFSPPSIQVQKKLKPFKCSQLQLLISDKKANEKDDVIQDNPKSIKSNQSGLAQMQQAHKQIQDQSKFLKQTAIYYQKLGNDIKKMFKMYKNMVKLQCNPNQIQNIEKKFNLQLKFTTSQSSQRSFSLLYERLSQQQQQFGPLHPMTKQNVSQFKE